MYNNFKHDEECFIIIKRPCGCQSNNNFPQEMRFKDENYYEEDFSEKYYQGFNDNNFERRPQKNPCRCQCHNHEQEKPRKRCCFNFFRCC